MADPKVNDEFVDAKPMIIDSLKAPHFNPKRVSLWFAQLEAQLASNGVAAEREKFNHAVSLIDIEYACEVESLIINPLTMTPYGELKATLIACYSKSDEAKLRQLLDGEAIGERSPSQILRHLKSLAPAIDDAVLKARWLANLPEKTQELLAISPTMATIDELAKTADKLHEMIPVTYTAAVASSSSSQKTMTLKKQVSEPSRQVAALTTAFNQNRDRSPARKQNRFSRRKSKTRKLDKTDICYYYTEFGKTAYKCTPGCKFSVNVIESH
ncbi:uncharacterized protein LOC103580629 [Microplitis demolitor]|uniref:uncharacterized protein LOC103580629 n=1 Tax=Microplitis demolitor TaxID=69319 RepID=UPI0004CDD28C|nr:uncharacterized protein LOC103580629 [Microplitis demolitor]